MNRELLRRPVLNECLFGIYLYAVLAVDLFCNHFHPMDITNPAQPFFVFLLLLAISLFLLIPPVFRILRGVRVKQRAPLSRRKGILIWLLGFVITALILLVWLAAFQWGQFSADSYTQLDQAATGSYSDWHPVWHTLLFFTMPMKLFGSKLMITGFQLFFFAIAMSYCFLTLYELAGPRYAFVSLCAIMLNPVLLGQLVFPWKDTAFAMTAMVAAAIALRQWCLEKDWSHSLAGAVFLGVLLANATLFRHNGALFTVFLLIALLFVQEKKRWIATTLVFALFLAVVRGPVYSALDVEKPGRRTLEAMGLPYTIIDTVVVLRPDLLDEETAEFVFSIAPLEIWQKYYEGGNFNVLKFKLPYEDMDRLDAAGARKILRMMGSCFRRAPLQALTGLLCLTDIVYSVSDTGPPQSFGSTPAKYRGDRLFGIVTEYSEIYSRSIFRCLSRIGTTLLIMLAAILAKCCLSSKKDWKRILLCLSVFCYDFGTMLLLTGPDARFFQVSFLVCPIFTLLMFYEKDTTAKEN